MKETIYTIPINEAFEVKCGCPLCTLRRKLEHDSVEYIMGAAMMEPDVRIETNRRGFCEKHYAQMLAMNGRLSLALTLESRLGEIRGYIEKEAVRGFGKKKVYISEYFCYALFAAARAKRFNCVGIAVCQIFRSRNGEKSAQTRRRAAKAADSFGQIIAHFRAGGTEGTIIFFQIAQKFRVVFKKGSRHTARLIDV